MKTMINPGCLALFGILCVAELSLAQARFVPLDFAVRDAKSVHGVLVEEGVFLNAGTATLFSCANQYEGEGVEGLLWTGHSEHALVVGQGGARLTVESGCHWRRTTGAVDGQRIVGHYQEQAGSDRVVFAVDDAFGGTAVMETVDGGFTSTVSGALAVTGVSFVAFGGSGAFAAIGARAVDGTLSTWWSEDAGEIFYLAPASGQQVSDGLESGGYASGQLWLWDEGTLYGVNAEGQVTSEEPPVKGPVAGGDDGVLWLAADAEGLWRRDLSGGWQQVHSEDTRAVQVVFGQLWVARVVEHAGEPVILRSDDDGASWWPAWLAPDGWAYPETCESSMAQLCREATVGLRESLGLSASSETVEQPSPPEDGVDGGCGAPGGPPGWPLLAGLCVALFVRSRRWVPGSP